MSHGSRRSLLRGIVAGIGTTLCIGVLGCTEIDKPKDWRIGNTNTKQPKAGLPGTTLLPGQPGTGIGQPNGQGGLGLVPAGGAGVPVGRNPGSTNFGAGASTNYNNMIVPPVGPNNTFHSNTNPAGGRTIPTQPGSPAGTTNQPILDPAFLPPPPPGTTGTVVPPGGMPLSPNYPN